MYKQRHESPNLKTTPKNNYDYVLYIAKRTGVAMNENSSHGLFGRLSQGSLVEFPSCYSVAGLASQNSKKGITMLRGDISFKEETAKEVGLLNKQDFQIYAEKHIFTLAEKNKIPMKNLQWAAAFHDKKGQPHLHIVFWDKDPQIQKQFVHPSIPNKIRQQLIHDTFGDKIFELGELKNELTKKIRFETKCLGSSVVETVGLLGKKRYDLIRGVYREGLGEEPLTLSNKSLNIITPPLFQLKEMIPKNGRLNYQLLPNNVKDHVNLMVETLLTESPELAQTVEKYINTRIQQAEIYGRVSPEKKLSYEKEAEKMIANGVMNMLRSINHLEWEFQREVQKEEEREFITDQMIGSLMELFREKKENLGRSREGSKKWNSLSKEARKEYALRNQDKGYEH